MAPNVLELTYRLDLLQKAVHWKIRIRHLKAQIDEYLHVHHLIVVFASQKAPLFTEDVRLVAHQEQLDYRVVHMGNQWVHQLMNRRDVAGELFFAVAEKGMRILRTRQNLSPHF